MADAHYLEKFMELDKIARHINEHKYENLEVFLSDYNWDSIGETILIPSNVREFIKEIENAEVRLDVAKFLKKYAKQYFREAAERLEYAEAEKNVLRASLVQIRAKTAEKYIEFFQQELGFLIEQIEQAGEFTGEHFSNLKNHITELEQKNAKLTEEKQKLHNEIAVLKSQIDELEHPERRHQIPNELQCDEFYYIITYLQKSGVVTPKQAPNTYYSNQLCYHWNKSKASFGYFVCKICYLLELRTKNDHLIWKPFKLAFENFSDLEKQARDHASNNKNWEDASSTKPDEAYFVDDALAYSADQIERTKAQKQR